VICFGLSVTSSWSVINRSVLKKNITRVGSREGDWGDRPPKAYKSILIHHDFVQFRKEHSRYMAIFPSIVLSQ